MSAKESIGWAIETFGPKLCFAVSFQKTSSVIIDIAHGIDPHARFFYLDTELLFDETYATRDALAARYGIEFERFVQANPPGLRERWEANLWREPDACCGIRKVETMRRALEGVDCWVSGVRRVDSQTRAGAARFGWDERFGRWKLNPLVDWTEQEVWAYINEQPRALQPASRRGLSLDRLHAVHVGAGRERRSPLGPLGRHCALGVRSEWVAPRPAWRCG